MEYALAFLLVIDALVGLSVLCWVNFCTKRNRNPCGLSCLRPYPNFRLEFKNVLGEGKKILKKNCFLMFDFILENIKGN